MHLNVLTPWTVWISEEGGHLVSTLSQGTSRGRRYAFLQQGPQRKEYAFVTKPLEGTTIS